MLRDVSFMPTKWWLLALAFLSTRAIAQVTYDQAFREYRSVAAQFDNRAKQVKASDPWVYRPTYLSVNSLAGFNGRNARLNEACSGQQLYPLRGLPFDMRCQHWDELNQRPWGLGRMEILNKPFKDAFRPP
jgi:hypothetical protein